jgi:hypothetical protein
MCGFDRLCFQGIAQSTRHSFRIAEIAHESTSSSANEKDRACIADPFANGAGAEEIDTLIIPDGGQAAGVSTLPLTRGKTLDELCVGPSGRCRSGTACTKITRQEARCRSILFLRFAGD